MVYWYDVKVMIMIQSCETGQIPNNRIQNFRHEFLHQWVSLICHSSTGCALHILYLYIFCKNVHNFKFFSSWEKKNNYKSIWISFSSKRCNNNSKSYITQKKKKPKASFVTEKRSQNVKFSSHKSFFIQHITQFLNSSIFFSSSGWLMWCSEMTGFVAWKHENISSIQNIPQFADFKVV